MLRGTRWTHSYLAVLQFARANNCDFDDSTCSVVACNRNLAVLQWLRANGSRRGPWDKDILSPE